MRRAIWCPAAPPAVLPDVRSPVCPLSSYRLPNEREREAASLHDSQCVEVAQRSFLLAKHAVTPSPERTGSS